MKRLILIRHAKTETYSASGSDRDRNLTARGINDAQKMAEYLQSINIQPDNIIASDANRAAQTTNIFAEQFNVDNSTIIWQQNLYLCPPSVIEDTIAISGLTDSCNTLFVIAHNSGISEYAFDKSNGGLSYALPTCGVAVLEFKTLKNWSEIYNSEAKLITTIFPKSL